MNESAPYRTFEEASSLIKASLEQFLEKHGGNFSENEGFDESQEIKDDVIESIFQSYGCGDEIKSTRNYVLDSLNSSCLICLSSIKRQEAIWSCCTCFSSFHLTCIQRWTKDSLIEQGNRKYWCCPKCRSEYSEKEEPQEYYCYCKKRINPELDSWLVPHSCGDICGKLLSSNCVHSCLLLCHPGPCPPCPQVVKSSCYCGKSAASRRCYHSQWSCKNTCMKLLSCKLHLCPSICHSGPCLPCKNTSVQLCYCKRHQKETECAIPQWNCDEKCSKQLSCGHHKCDIICHEGDCPPCPLTLPRTCPCGKHSYQLDCILATPTCGDTCDKLLSCNLHTCVERCHRGNCGTCFQIITKHCRCGLKAKDVLCTKDFMCDIKCKKMKACGKHLCNKKCCDGYSCLTCDQKCNKTLSCKNHKCASVCHTGSCYPCTEMKTVSCFCGANVIQVPCGMEKKGRTVKCKKKCNKESTCHHSKIQPHACHFGPCPPCSLRCGKVMKCGHECKVPCHDLVQIKTSRNVSGPWDRPVIIETKAVSCPPCQALVLVSCLGKHEEVEVPCTSAKVTSCGRICGRKLDCGNHVCQRECHKVKKALNNYTAGSNCQKCELNCEQTRSDGCHHACQLQCHPGECPPCTQTIWINCHCGMNKLYIQCAEWNTADESMKQELGSCKDRCPKIMRSCGHRCPMICHSGPCSKKELCQKRIKLVCRCRQRKMESICSKVKNKKLSCDSLCQSKPPETYDAKEKPDDKLDVRSDWKISGTLLLASVIIVFLAIFIVYILI